MIRYGTCSWKYDSWKGIVYPDKEKFNHLEEYSKHFNTVEIDQWFWSLFSLKKVTLPDKNVVKSYAESVPADFKFTIKIPNSITLTHFYNKDKTQPLVANPYFLNRELFDAFLDTLTSMYEKIGVLMFQFEYLNKLKMSGVKEFIKRFEEFLASINKSFIYGIEIRNPNYITSDYFSFLERNGIAMVFLQGYYMPPIWEVYEKMKSYLNATTVIRLHGPDRSGIEEKAKGNWSAIIEPKDAELRKAVHMINEINDKGVDLFVNVNNHYEGSAPLTIERVRGGFSGVSDKK